jgi:hypothetical protein
MHVYLLRFVYHRTDVLLYSYAMDMYTQIRSILYDNVLHIPVLYKIDYSRV